MHNRPTLHNSVLYKQYRNKSNKILISAEKAHLKELFQRPKDNLQTTWQILKQVINKQQMNRRNDTFKIKDKLSTNAIQICEHFNELFIKCRTNTLQEYSSARFRYIRFNRKTWTYIISFSYWNPRKWKK